MVIKEITPAMDMIITHMETIVGATEEHCCLIIIIILVTLYAGLSMVGSTDWDHLNMEIYLQDILLLSNLLD